MRILSFFTFFCSAVFLCAADSLTLLDPVRDINCCNTYGTSAERELSSDKSCIEIRYQPNGKSNGSFQRFDLQKCISGDGDYDRIGITMRGNGSIRVFADCTDRSTYCWNGKGWDSSSVIAVPSKWTEKILYLKDFKSAFSKEFPPVSWKKIQKIHLSEISVKTPSVLYVRNIRLIARGAKTEMKKTLKKESLPEIPERAVAVVPGKEFWQNGKFAGSSFTEWDKIGFERSTSARRKIYLNGYWQLIPVKESSVRRLLGTGLPLPEVKEPVSGKEKVYTKVPGRWDGRNFYLLSAAGKHLEKWENEEFCNYVQAYLGRSFTLPQDCAGKRFLLEFKGIQTDGVLFIDGKKIASFRKNALFDVSKLLVPGKKQEIALHITNKKVPLSKDPWSYGLMKQIGPKWFYNFSEGPGITGDVILHVYPQQVNITDMQVLPLVSQGRIGTCVSVRNRSGKEENLVLKNRILDHGVSVLVFPEKKIVLPPGKTVSVTLETPWNNARKWSPDDPYLYEMQTDLVQAKTGALLDSVQDSFGYRELKINKAHFELNGIPLRLNFISNQGRYRMLAPENLRELLRSFKAMHYNGIMVEELDEERIRICDEIGLMVVMRHIFTPLVREGTYLPGVPNKGIPFRAWLEDDPLPEARKELENQMLSITSMFRNNPSIVLWALNPLVMGAPDWINPNRLTEPTPESDIKDATLRQEAFLRRIDPVREVIQSMAGSTGKVNTCNPYPTFSIQPDEWADWPKVWASVPEEKKLPLLLEEVELPYCGNWGTWLDPKTNAMRSYGERRELFCEHASRYSGDMVYTNLKLGTGWESHSDASIRGPDGISRSDLNPAAERTDLYWMDRIFKFWRWYGISGIWNFRNIGTYFANSSRKTSFETKNASLPGRHPDFAPAVAVSERSGAFEVMRKVQRPFLAFLANDGPDFSSLEHNYYGGETVRKSILVSNHASSDALWSAEWKVQDLFTGKIIAAGTASGKLAPARSSSVSLRFRLPETKEKRRYCLTLFARGFGEHSTDSFEFASFPRLPIRASESVLLYDEKGWTRQALEKCGVKILPFTGKESFGKNLPLVVGTDSLSSKFMDLARESGLDDAMRNGMNLLICAQTSGGAMKQLLEERRTRHVFIRDAEHPFLKGIAEEDLHHWRGKSALVPEWPKHGSGIPHRFMFWGSKDVVGSFAADKPCTGNFRVILDCDANLSRSLLFEVFHGKGRVIFSQLELENRLGLEPAADRLFLNLLSDLKRKNVSAEKILFFAGTKSTLEELGKLGFEIREYRGKGLPGNALLIADSSVRKEDLPEKGTILFLNARPEMDRALLRKNTSHTLIDPSVPALRGLGNGDFHLALPMDRTLFHTDHFGPSLFGERHSGKGHWLFLGIAPEKDFRNWNASQAKRIVSAILTNLGARAKAMLLIADPDKCEIDLSSQKVPFAIDPFDKGMREKWFSKGFDDSKWKKIRTGISWEDQGFTMKNPNPEFRLARPASAYGYDGISWYRIRVRIPGFVRGKNPVLHIHSIDDTDQIFFNGVLIGETSEKVPHHWEKPRDYAIPEKLIAFDRENVIAVRVGDNGGGGGIIGDCRIIFDGAYPSGKAFYEPSDRKIKNFDPNAFRQW